MSSDRLCRQMVGIILGASLLHSCGFEVVDTGYRGVYTRFGEIQGEPLPEGMHFYNPMSGDIKKIDVRERKLEKQSDFFTKDTQHVRVNFVITYYPDPSKVHNLFKQFGDDWDSKIIEPAALGSVRDVIGRYVADDLVSSLEQAKLSAQEELKVNLATRGVFLGRLDVTGVDFDAAYKDAIEAKVVAVQRAAEAKNKTVEIEEKARQQVISAKAEAESMEIRSQALSKNKGLVDYVAVEKWDGKLPQYMLGGAVPFIKLPGQ